MSAAPCKHLDDIRLHVLDVDAKDDAVALEAHVEQCNQCRAELDALRSVVEAFVAWPTDVLRPAVSLWERIAHRIADESGEPPAPRPVRSWSEPGWSAPAPGIRVKLLAADTDNHRVSMLVHLDPGVAYPPHQHAGVEELHLLDGVLQVDEKTLYPGDYLRSIPGTSDALVRSETGCTCVLITSTLDELR